MNEIITATQSIPVTVHPFREYDQYKIAVMDEINSASESFVKIGYLLKVARDTDILINSGYSNYLEFAREEFSLDAGTVSRFIKINDKYSVDHNTPELLPEFRGYGRAKLQEMITLPDYLSETFTPELTKSEIQTIKAEYEEEQAVTDLEVMMEEGARDHETNIRRFIYKLFHDKADLFKRVYEAVRKNRAAGGKSDSVVIIDELLPGEIQLYITRPEGLGRMQLKLAEDMDGAELLNMRSGEKETISNDDLISAVLFQINSGLINHEDYTQGYNRRYKEPFPEEKSEVAPVQPKEKKSHVTVAKPKPNDKPKKQETVQKSPESVQKEPESVQKEPEIVKESSEMFESGKTDAGSEPLTTAPIAPDHQPVPLPEAGQGTDAPVEEKKTMLDAQLKAADDDGINTLMNKRLKQLNDCIHQIMTKRFSKIAVFEALDSTRELVKILEEVERRKAG